MLPSLDGKEEVKFGGGPLVLGDRRVVRPFVVLYVQTKKKSVTEN